MGCHSDHLGAPRTVHFAASDLSEEEAAEKEVESGEELTSRPSILAGRKGPGGGEGGEEGEEEEERRRTKTDISRC